MSTFPPPDEVLGPRPEEAQDITKILERIHGDEQMRRRRALLVAGAPWLISAVFGMFAIGAGFIVAKRPIPKPEMHVSIYRSDGSVEAPVERGNLSADRKAFIIRSDLQQFMIAWESYAFMANQSYYDRVSAMTAGGVLQTQYQDSWITNNRDPNNREVKYGKTAVRNVAAISSAYVPQDKHSVDGLAPNVLTGRMLIKLTTLAGSTCEWWAANLTFKQDNNELIPLDKQLAYDPSDVSVISYFSTPADPNARPWPC